MDDHVTGTKTILTMKNQSGEERVDRPTILSRTSGSFVLSFESGAGYMNSSRVTNVT